MEKGKAESGMNKLQLLTEEIRNLSSGELAVLRAWFHDFDSIDSRRSIDAYLPQDQSPGDLVPRTDSDHQAGGDQSKTMAMELATSMREAYLQVAFQEYAQFVAADLGASALAGHPCR